jgi:hypothetical protein
MAPYRRMAVSRCGMLALPGGELLVSDLAPTAPQAAEVA